jgi:hypothetical protein
MGGQAEGGPTGAEGHRDGVPGCEEGTDGPLWPLQL